MPLSFCPLDVAIASRAPYCLTIRGSQWQVSYSFSHSHLPQHCGRRTRQRRVHAHLAAEQREATVDAGVRARHRGDRQHHVLDAAHVLARVVEVEQPFRDLDLARAGRFQLEELQREVQPQRDVLVQLVLTDVRVEVRLLHRPQRQLEPLAGQQAFVERVPGFARHESRAS